MGCAGSARRLSPATTRKAPFEPTLPASLGPPELQKAPACDNIFVDRDAFDESSLDGCSTLVPMPNAGELMYDSDSSDEGQLQCHTREETRKVEVRACDVSEIISECVAQDSAAAPMDSAGVARDEEAIALGSDRLLKHAWEVMALFRVAWAEGADLEELRVRVRTACSFVNDVLPRAAEALGSQSQGAVFQSLLAELPHEPRSRRHSSLSLDTFRTDALAELVLGARGLCNLVRLKVEDDEDLALAREVLKDCQTFLCELAALARRKGTSDWEFLQELLRRA